MGRQIGKSLFDVFPFKEGGGEGKGGFEYLLLRKTA